ncbi:MULTISPECIES: DUF192 domain-containing protein [Hyphobacterium]|uniref:DUF192 domain-containing protein n=1 Tax=Hyphobacterium vulgare TaxID=1736751 RepID=A0ABV6ZTA3_9PROT
MLKHALTALVLLTSAPALAQLPDARLEAQPGDPAHPETVIDFGDPQPLTIVTDEAEIAMSVLFADTDPERARGLMFREELADDSGMLFDFETVRPVSMWMRNTLIPLDIVFLSEEGVIVKIVANARPHSLRQLLSDFPVRAVLEVRGGLTGELGVMPGDRVEHAMFPMPETDETPEEEAPADDAGTDAPAETEPGAAEEE